MRTIAIVQARMGSTRLPGKVLRPLAGRPVLEHVVRRLQRTLRLDGLIVATTTEPADTAVAEAAARLGVPVFRGSEGDVLDRYYQAATAARAEEIVRITADCPFISPEVIGAMILAFREGRRRGADYLSNTLVRSFPRGLDAELFTYEALARAWREGKDPVEREHVTPYIYRHPEIFRLEPYTRDEDASRFRLTLDTPEDMAALDAICQGLGGDPLEYTLAEILAFLEAHPEVVALNADVEQKPLGG